MNEPLSSTGAGTEAKRAEGAPAIEVTSLAKTYHMADGSALDALRGVSFRVGRGEVLGVIGRNGAGKTTLLNILGGVLSPTSGEVSARGRVRGLYSLGTGFRDELSGRENVFLNGALLGASRRELESKLAGIAEFSELGDFLDRPLGSYSQGMRLRLAFGILANLDCDALVMDEVLAVGDMQFQSRCFERLMDFRRAGTALVVSTQDMGLVERLCTRVLVMDRGRAVFEGDVREGIDRYRGLLNRERFSAGAAGPVRLVENTKRWADDIGVWGERLGTKEVAIESFETFGARGRPVRTVSSGDPLRLRVGFFARSAVEDPHFGVALFRSDGVYCYGPNTAFDGLAIKRLPAGRGWFSLEYPRLPLGPGRYVFSVGIWDREEKLAYDYHNGCYALEVSGGTPDGAGPDAPLLNVPFVLPWRDRLKRMRAVRPPVSTAELGGRFGNRKEAAGMHRDSIRLLGPSGRARDRLRTGEAARLCADPGALSGASSDCILWAGVFREDGVFCFDVTWPGPVRPGTADFKALPLLPGGYRLSIGAWNRRVGRFEAYAHGLQSFSMVFDRPDHGTVYIPHSWGWGTETPSGRAFQRSASRCFMRAAGS